MNPYYLQPPIRHTANGELRRVGFELEFAGLTLVQVADIVHKHLGGELEKRSEADYLVHTDEFGDFRIELDWSFAKNTAQERVESEAVEGVNDPLMAWVTEVAGQLVPAEIVGPPITLEQLDCLDPVITALRDAGARGTGDAPIYAFGVHINPELSDLKPATIVAYLQSFVLAQDWLFLRHEVDLARRVTPYIDRFSSAYALLVLEYSGEESVAQLIDDYLRHNATRNRGLDMLPLFNYIDEERIGRVMDDPRINARPTLHYRLPNCEIEQLDWSLNQSWNVWCLVESLADDVDFRHSLNEEAREYFSKTIKLKEQSWLPRLDQRHQDLLSA